MSRSMLQGQDQTEQHGAREQAPHGGDGRGNPEPDLRAGLQLEPAPSVAHENGWAGKDAQQHAGERVEDGFGLEAEAHRLA